MGQDNRRAFIQPAHDLRLQVGEVVYLQMSELREVIDHNVRRPPVAVSEQSAHGHLQDIVTVPDRYFGVCPVAIAKGLPSLGWIGKIQKDPDALLFDSEGGNLGET